MQMQNLETLAERYAKYATQIGEQETGHCQKYSSAGTIADGIYSAGSGGHIDSYVDSHGSICIDGLRGNDGGVVNIAACPKNQTNPDGSCIQSSLIILMI